MANNHRSLFRVRNMKPKINNINTSKRKFFGLNNLFFIRIDFIEFIHYVNYNIEIMIILYKMMIL